MATYKAHCVYGALGKEVNVVVTGRLALQPNAQAGYVDCGNDWIALVSYESEIFRVNTRTKEISFEYSDASPSYSRTTARHVGSFCKEFCSELSYHDIKEFYKFYCDNYVGENTFIHGYTLES